MFSTKKLYFENNNLFKPVLVGFTMKFTNRTVDETLLFFQGLVGQGYRAFSIEVNKERIMEETNEKKVIEILKGATLIPLHSIRRTTPFSFFLKEPGEENSAYFVEHPLGSLNYNYVGDVEVQNGVRSLNVDYLRDFDPTQITAPWIRGIPDKMVAGSLSMRSFWTAYSDVNTGNTYYSVRGSASKGEGLFGKLIGFLDSETAH